MANFDSGVSGYVRGHCEIEVFFPIDMKGNEDISCKQCRYYSPTYRSCKLTGDVVAYPDKYVGQTCPLEMEDKDEVSEN